MITYLAIDDTDMPDTIGTGKLSREIAEELEKKYPVLCVTRHQFFVHPDIPYTSHNSGAVIHLSNIPAESCMMLCDEAITLMRNRFIPGSDPGICLLRHDQVRAPLIIYGQDAKTKILTQEQARKLAANMNIPLFGLGGTNGGIIGALAGAVLAASGLDGRILQIGTIRDQTGPMEINDLLKTGIEEIISVDGRDVTEGLVHFRKFPQPIRIFGKPVLLVEEIEGQWYVVKRD